jgi:hypothetical protein
MNGWVRVSHREPCPVCKKTDWCGLSADRTLACCMRVEDGSHGHAKNGGWIHRIGPERPYPRPPMPRHPPPPAPPRIDAEGLWRRWQQETPSDAIDIEAERLGVGFWAWGGMGAVLSWSSVRGMARSGSGLERVGGAPWVGMVRGKTRGGHRS